MITLNFKCGYEYTVEVVKNKTITVTRAGSVPRTFAIGDWCEEDSFNLSYTGKITSITDKSVVVQPKLGTRKRRMKFEEFAWRNWDFDQHLVALRNAEISHYI